MTAMTTSISTSVKPRRRDVKLIRADRMISPPAALARHTHPGVIEVRDVVPAGRPDGDLRRGRRPLSARPEQAVRASANDLVRLGVEVLVGLPRSARHGVIGRDSSYRNRVGRGVAV